MSHHPWWTHLAHSAGHAANHGSKAGAVMLIVIGFFLAPMLIGIPILAYGFYKLLN